MPELVNDLVSSFVIRELTGDKRRVVLRKRALPYRPFELSGTQRYSVEWYPGSPIGTMQVYGAKEEPTTITGQWKDMFISEHLAQSSLDAAAFFVEEGSLDVVQFIDNVRDLVKLIDDIRRKGQELEVTWLDQARRGILERFSARWHTGHDVEWDMGFQWISQAESFKDLSIFDAGAGDVSDVPNKCQAWIDDIVAVPAGELVPQTGSRGADAALTLQDIGANIQEFADQLQDAVVALSGDLTSHNDAVRRVSGILDGIKLEADLLSEIAEGTADGIALDTGAISSINSTLRSFGEILSTRAAIREQSLAAQGLRNFAAVEQAVLLKKVNAELIHVFQAREGQDLRAVSTEFYGNPDEWRALMVYNNLGESGLHAGQVIFIPAQPPQDLC